MNNTSKILIVFFGLLVLLDGISLLLFGKAWRYMLGYQAYLEPGYERFLISSIKLVIGTFLIYKFKGIELIQKIIRGTSSS